MLHSSCIVYLDEAVLHFVLDHGLESFCNRSLPGHGSVGRIGAVLRERSTMLIKIIIVCGSDPRSVRIEHIGALRYNDPAGGGGNGGNTASRHLRHRNLFQLRLILPDPTTQTPENEPKLLLTG